MSDSFSSFLYSAAGIALGTYFLHRWVVPPFKGNLGSLKNCKNADKVYKEHFWPESHYVDLPHGKTHYFLLGPKDGKKVLFVHGITAPSPCFPEFVEGLAKKGFRVLTYGKKLVGFPGNFSSILLLDVDTYGRGYSDSPGTVYDDALYVSQLLGLVTKLGWTKFDIIGLSLGGAITVDFASKFPEMINRVSFIAPAGMMDGLPLIARVATLPVIGPLFFFTVAPIKIPQYSKNNHTLSAKECFGVAHLSDLNVFHLNNHPGVYRAYYSTLLHFSLGGREHQYASLEKHFPGRVMCIWGDLDYVVPFTLNEKFTKLIPSSKLIIRKGLGHSVPAEDPNFCVDHIASFISS